MITTSLRSFGSGVVGSVKIEGGGSVRRVAECFKSAEVMGKEDFEAIMKNPSVLPPELRENKKVLIFLGSCDGGKWFDGLFFDPHVEKWVGTSLPMPAKWDTDRYKVMFKPGAFSSSAA